MDKVNKAIHDIASACGEVFELTGRSVPSNHQRKITSLAKQMEEIKKLFSEPKPEEKKSSEEII
jgi:hypothetical protein